ncbi:MAG: hypothetical protein CBD27_05975 [Rhodospirillaceae bacterium TMED167]|nr:extradiol dioxygenase [Rhodospirillaceae bacterium]OUW27544.1 MAG: hypothetical protein CBD27_05975 [Rhodospirillaceae bacterium TMED167]
MVIVAQDVLKLDESLVRQPAVAGTFYPSNPTELAATVQFYLSQAKEKIGTACLIPPKAIIVPHAGYVYSGLTAAAAYNSLRMQSDKITRVIMMGPCHRVGIAGLALPSTQAFSTPLGSVPVDTDATAKIIRLDQVKIFNETHKNDHALEVHLPFLQTILTSFSIVPLIVGQAAPSDVAEVLDLLWGGEETLILISSDLSHYQSYKDAQKVDDFTRQAIEQLDAQALGDQQACGRHSIKGLMEVARKRGLRVSTADVRNSGDTAGAKDKVVGYGSWLFSYASEKVKSNAPQIVNKEKHFGDTNQKILDQYGEALLVVAAKAIQNSLRKQAPLRINLASFPRELQDHGACFVTLNKDGKLRGCIGSIQAWRPLVTDVAENSCKAAFQDTRFAKLSAQELIENDISIHISVLGPQTPISFSSEADLISQVRPGMDGLVLIEGKHRGVFLPIVWNSLPDAPTFLRQLKRKAGLSEDYWSDGLQVFRYVTRGISSGALPSGVNLWQINRQVE